MGFVIGANPYSGRLVETVDYQRGKGFKPGTRAVLNDPATGESKEFVAVKLNAATWINGVAVILDGLSTSGVGSAVATASGLPAATINARLGILTFSSATATHTTSTTAYGWAQIYGTSQAWVSASVTIPGQQLAIGASGQLIAAVAQVSASGQVNGMTCIGTQTASTTANLRGVFLNYPVFNGLPDANLA